MKLLSTLVHDGTEYFLHENNLLKVNAGQTTEINKLPDGFLMLLDAELATDKKAQLALAKMGVTHSYLRLYHFFKCNYSAFGGDADVKNNGRLGSREIVPCANRDNCQYEGRLCKLPNSLTKKEAMITRAIARAEMDAEINHNLNISQNTLRSHKNNIENKTGKQGKIAIAGWAHKIGLL